MMDDMKARSQESTQAEIDFLTQMCTLRDNILAMTKQEEHPINEENVKKRVHIFLYTKSFSYKLFYYGF